MGNVKRLFLLLTLGFVVGLNAFQNGKSCVVDSNIGKREKNSEHSLSKVSPFWLSRVSGGATTTATRKKVSKSKRTIRMKKKSLKKRFFGQYIEIIKAFFDSLIDPEYENTLEPLPVPVNGNNLKKKRTKRFGGLDDLPPEPKG